MAVAKGRAFLLYVEDGVSAVPTAKVTSFGDWELVAAAQTVDFDLTTEEIEATVAPTGGASSVLWGARLAGAKQVSVTANLRFTNAKAERILLNKAVSETAQVKLLMAFPSESGDGSDDLFSGQIAGEFMISSWSASAGIADPWNGTVTMVSTGTVNFILPS